MQMKRLFRTIPQLYHSFNQRKTNLRLPGTLMTANVATVGFQFLVYRRNMFLQTFGIREYPGTNLTLLSSVP